MRASYLVVAACGSLRLFAQSASLRILAFLTFWLVAGVLPAYQTWDIGVNLVGSRLFYLSSAPFVMLLSFLALPAIDAMKARMVKVLTCVGSLALFVVLSVWSVWLHFDLQAWIAASESLKAFKNQVIEALGQVSSSKSILVLNLPTDYSGAGILTQGRYLKFMLRPPFQAKIIRPGS